MYTNWKIGDQVEIGVKVEDFCSSSGGTNYLFLGSYDMELYPAILNTPCTRPNCSFSCLDTTNVQVFFYSCLNYQYTNNDVNCTNRVVGKFYRNIGTISSNTNGIASFTYIVTNQDLLDYNDAISSGGNYNIVACINDVRATVGHAINFGNITITCPTCPPKCYGNDLYNQVCDQSTGNCIQGTIISPGTCAPNTGIIYFDSNPQSAEIWYAISPNAPINSGYLTPATFTNIPTGTYNYIFKKVNYEDYSGSIIVSQGQTTSVYGQMVPFVNYELYFSVSDIIPASFVSSVVSTIFNGVVNTISGLTSYYVDSVNFDPTSHIITVAISRLPQQIQAFSEYNIQDLQISYLELNTIAAAITVVILFALGIIGAPLAFAALAIDLIVNYSAVTFLGKKESVIGALPSTRSINCTAEICTGTATNPCNTTSPITADMIVEVTVTYGNQSSIKTISASSPTLTFSVPTDSDISIVAKVKDNPYYTPFTADPQSNPDLKSCTPGSSCPTTVPITIKFFSQADAKVSPKVTDTSGNSLSGKYTLWIEDSRGVKVQDGSGDLVNGQVPEGVIPANKEYCVLIIPSDYPTHGSTFTCSKCLSGQICSPTLVSKTCPESKNSVTVRCVYVSATGARLGFIPEGIDITNISTNSVRHILPGTPSTGSTCPGVISSDMTCIDGLENGNTYKVHVISSTYTVTSATQNQQVSYTTDCLTGIMLTVEASPPPNTFDITIQVINSQTLTALPGAIVMLGTMPGETTDQTGSVMFPSVPQGTGIPLKVTLTGYKDNSGTVDVTSSKTVTISMEVDQTLQTIDTRIRDFGNIGEVIATKPVKFKGYLESLSDTTYAPLTDAPVAVTVKDKDGNTVQTLSATTQSGSGLIGAGYFETGEWLITNNLVNTQISVNATFSGLGRYKSSTSDTTYAVMAPANCIIPIPFSNSCLLSSGTVTEIAMIGGLALGGYLVFKYLSKPKHEKPASAITTAPITRTLKLSTGG